VTDAARRGDALAREILEEAGVVLGVGIVNLLHLFDPALVIIGGGVMQAGDLIWEPMRRIVETRAMPVYRRTFRLASPALNDNAGLFGAAALAFDLVSLTPSQRTSPS
jgi:glucokinase